MTKKNISTIDLFKDIRLSKSAEFEFEGIGFTIAGRLIPKPDANHTYQVKMLIDGKQVEISNLPTDFNRRKAAPFWRYNLPKGKHVVQLEVLNPSDAAVIRLVDLIVYRDKPIEPKH